ncbi:MAG: aminopeptidase P family N-terminal domain-containing protein, partial [Halanaerobiales bacterium]
MKKRIEKVRQLMEKEDLDALLIDSNVNRFYLTGFTGTSGRVLFTPYENYFITDFRYREQAEAETNGYVVEEISRKIIKNIGELLHKEGVKVL